MGLFFVFFFSSRRRHTRFDCDWSSDVCSSDLEEGIAVVRAFAEELDLTEPVMPWHAQRGRIAEIAGALGEASGAAGKPARDVILLAQTEVEEVREGVAGRG